MQLAMEMHILKPGDLVVYKGNARFNLPSPTFCDEHDYWLVLRVTNSKKTWHRSIVLFGGKEIISVPWREKDIFEVVCEC